MFRRALMVGAACLASLAVAPSGALAQTSELSARGRALATWLADSDLGKSLSLIAVRRIAHPLREDGRRVIAVELRSTTDPESAAHGLKYLFALSDRFARDHGESLWEKLLYKAAHVLEVPRDSTIVSIIVLHEELLVYTDSSRAVRTFTSASRMVIDRVDIPAERVGSIVAVGAAGDTFDTRSAAASRAVVGFLRQRFAAGQVRVIAEDDGHVQVSIGNIRNAVIDAPRLWERLHLSFDLVPLSGRLRIIVHADGQYAAGAGANPPAEEAFRDMEPRYAKRLKEYVGAMLVDLKTSMTQ